MESSEKPPAEQAEKLSDIVDRAICVLDKLKWMREQLFGEWHHNQETGEYEVGAVCAVGAIKVAAHKTLSRRELLDKGNSNDPLVEEMVEKAGLSFMRHGAAGWLYDYNDNVARSKQDVKDRLATLRDRLKTMGY